MTAIQTNTRARIAATKKRSDDIIDRMKELQARGLECDPVQILMEIASGKKLLDDGSIVNLLPPPEPKDRMKAASELCSYIYPKQKAITISGNLDKPIAFAVVHDPSGPPQVPASHQDQLTGSAGVVLEGQLSAVLPPSAETDDEFAE